MENILKKLGITPGPWKVTEKVDKSLRINSENITGIAEIGEGKNDKRDAVLIAAAPEMFLWIYGMVDSADEGNMIKAAKLLKLGHELIEKATGLEWEKIKETT